jgi:hypothetical protein
MPRNDFPEDPMADAPATHLDGQPSGATPTQGKDCREHPELVGPFRAMPRQSVARADRRRRFGTFSRRRA